MDDINNIDWIDEMQNEEKKYKKFYKKNITKISIGFFYPDNDNQKIVYKLNNPSYITTSEISALMGDKPNYYIHEIFKYNADIDNDDINDYLESSSVSVSKYCKGITDNDRMPFITKEKIEDDIFFNDTIAMFEKVNTLFIFLKFKDDNTNDNTHNNKSKRQKNINANKKTRKIKKTVK